MELVNRVDINLDKYTQVPVLSDTGTKKYVVYIPKVQGQPTLCSCPAGLVGKECKHPYRATIRREFRDACSAYEKYVGRSWKNLWDKCLFWATKEYTQVAHKHRVKNRAIELFLEKVKMALTTWLGQRHLEVVMNAKALGLVIGTLTEESIMGDFHEAQKNDGIYAAHGKYSDMSYLKERYRIKIIG